MAIVYEQYEWICYQDLEWLLENNISRYPIIYRIILEVRDDSERRSSDAAN